jgi:hypothetical protein
MPYSMKCDRCGVRSVETRHTSGGFDHCADCGATLCPTCMEKGCCGEKPARSGTADDCPDEE